MALKRFYEMTPETMRQVTESGATKQTVEKETSSVLTGLLMRGPFDTGILPPGVRSFGQAGSHAQAVVECPPGLNLLYWGEHEGDANAKLFRLAQPWRILIIDFNEGNLLGVRMFYSPDPVHSLDQQLYHANVPNLNCNGYRGTSVGWLCLYLRESFKEMTWAARITRAIERASGGETFNANMSETDGPYFYRVAGKPAHTHDPFTWEHKSSREGYEWTLDRDLWFPVQVSDSRQRGHYSGGEPLTLGMAMNGDYSAYYEDKGPKPLLDLRNGRQPEPSAFFVHTMDASFVRAPKKFDPPRFKDFPIISCDGCSQDVSVQQAVTLNGVSFCPNCQKDFKFCESCNDSYHADHLVLTDDDEYFCEDCFPGCFCSICYQATLACQKENPSDLHPYLNDIGLLTNCICKGCKPPVVYVWDVCSICETPREPKRGLVRLFASCDAVLAAAEKATDVYLCPTCINDYVYCSFNHEPRLIPRDQCLKTKLGGFFCQECVIRCATCQWPTLRSEVSPFGGKKICYECQEDQKREKENPRVN